MSLFSTASFITMYLLLIKLSESFSDDKTLEIPESCVMNNKNYCFEKGDNYPEEQILRLMKEVVETVKPFDIISPLVIPASLNKRNDDCPARLYVDQLIYYIIDDDSNVRAVVQLPPKFEQKFDVVECKHEGRIENSRHFDNATNTEFYCENCKEPISVYTLSLDQTSIEKVAVRNGIPVCCKCVVKGPNEN